MYTYVYNIGMGGIDKYHTTVFKTIIRYLVIPQYLVILQYFIVFHGITVFKQS